MKQEQAQAGVGSDQASGQLARLTGQQQGQLAETESAIGIEQLQAQERAAGTLAAEGKVQSDIDLARGAQGLNEKQFGEYVRQFEVGSDQWTKAFDENRDYKWQAFDEQKREFDVNSDQWAQAHEAQQDQWAKQFEEQRAQFDVG